MNGSSSMICADNISGTETMGAGGAAVRRGSWARFAAVFWVFAAAAFALHARNSREVIPPSAPLGGFPAVIGDWSGQDIPLSREQLAVLGPGEFLMRDYREERQVRQSGRQLDRLATASDAAEGREDGAEAGAGQESVRVARRNRAGVREEGAGERITSGENAGGGDLGAEASQRGGGSAVQEAAETVNLYVAYYPSQRTGDTIHSPQNCLPGSGWTPLTSSRVQLERPGGGVLTVNRYVVAQGSDRMLVYYWYQAHGRVTASEYWAKIFLVTDAIRMNRTDGALVRVMAPFDNPSQETQAQAEALAFTKQMFPLLDSYIPR